MLQTCHWHLATKISDHSKLRRNLGEIHRCRRRRAARYFGTPPAYNLQLIEALPCFDSTQPVCLQIIDSEQMEHVGESSMSSPNENDPAINRWVSGRHSWKGQTIHVSYVLKRFLTS